MSRGPYREPAPVLPDELVAQPSTSDDDAEFAPVVLICLQPTDPAECSTEWRNIQIVAASIALPLFVTLGMVVFHQL